MLRVYKVNKQAALARINQIQSYLNELEELDSYLTPPEFELIKLGFEDELDDLRAIHGINIPELV